MVRTALWRAVEEYGVSGEEQALDCTFEQVFLGFVATPDDTVLLLGGRRQWYTRLISSPNSISDRGNRKHALRVACGGQEAWWEVLGVSPEADKQAIVNAFRALARRYHPDPGGDPADFKRLRGAYETALTAIEYR